MSVYILFHLFDVHITNSRLCPILLFEIKNVKLRYEVCVAFEKKITCDRKENWTLSKTLQLF